MLAIGALERRFLLALLRNHPHSTFTHEDAFRYFECLAAFRADDDIDLCHGSS